jgi:hypothetical protein
MTTRMKTPQHINSENQDKNDKSTIELILLSPDNYAKSESGESDLEKIINSTSKLENGTYRASITILSHYCNELYKSQPNNKKESRGFNGSFVSPTCQFPNSVECNTVSKARTLSLAMYDDISIIAPAQLLVLTFLDEGVLQPLLIGSKSTLAMAVKYHKETNPQISLIIRPFIFHLHDWEVR